MTSQAPNYHGYRFPPENARVPRLGCGDVCLLNNEEPESSRDYFGLHAIEDGDKISYQLPYGAWIRLFRQNALEVEDLVEL